MSLEKRALEYHAEKKGKLAVEIKVDCETKEQLSLAYSPGVAYPCLEIEKDNDLAYKYTNKGNFVAVVTDGTAVLGLGDIGAVAGMPVMEGKAILFKKFANIDAFPICIDTKDVDEIVNIVKKISPTFGGINLEDIAAPRCFEIEERLIAELDIPVFHDDQHGTAIVSLAGIINAYKIVGKKIGDAQIVINGAGAAANSIAKILVSYGAKKENIVMLDSKGAITTKRVGLDKYKSFWATSKSVTNLEEALVGADIFLGVSVADALKPQMLEKMAKDPLVFAMANPVPEILPDIAHKVRNDIIMATGRSDFSNQVNNVLGFPGIFRGALDVRAKKINDEMKMAASLALAALIDEKDLRKDYIIPLPFDKRVVPAVAAAVAEAAKKTGVV